MPSISAAQIRGACTMLNWTLMDLAQAASVSVATVRQAERDGAQPVSAGSDGALRVALEMAGISLLDDDGSGAGIRLKPR